MPAITSLESAHCGDDVAFGPSRRAKAILGLAEDRGPGLPASGGTELQRWANVERQAFGASGEDGHDHSSAGDTNLGSRVELRDALGKRQLSRYPARGQRLGYLVP